MVRSRGRVAYRLYKLRASFWFVPGVMVTGAFLVAAATLWLDRNGASALLRPLGVPFSIEENAARELLSTLAGAMVTVVSLVFSLTLVTLTVAAGNLGARLLERYMQNRVTQVTMGLFVGTFVYSIAVLATIGAGDVAVPALSVVLVLLHSLAAVGWLMYAFHDLARSLQIDQAAAEIGLALREQITAAATYARDAAGGPAGALPDGGTRRMVEAGRSAYVEAIDWDMLAALARDNRIVVDVLVAQGDHVTEPDPIAALIGTGVSEAGLGDAVRAAVTLGSVRTEADDLMFLVHLLLEIACRALSPGVNDMYTALTCADHLTGALAHAFRERLERIAVHDGDGGRLLVRTRSADIPRMVDAVLSTLRRNGTANVTFTLRLIRCVERLAPVAAGHPAAALILHHLERIAEDAAAAAPTTDRAAIEAAAQGARHAFGNR